jgi:hypothetical protein
MKYIVSDEHRFIYFVVQKVACSSIKTALLPLFEIDATRTRSTWKENTDRLRVHEAFGKSGYQVNKQQLLPRLDGEYRGYFKFAFVRNPWERLVSCYSDKIANGGEGLKSPARGGIAFFPGMPFADFVEAIHATPDNEADIHLRSQYKVVCGRGKSRRTIMADFVGRFENLEADFAAVANRIDSTQRLRLPHLLSSAGRNPRRFTELYDDRLRGLVHERYRDDIELFGYSFGGGFGASE